MSLQTRPRAPNRRWLLVPVIVAALALAYALAGFVLAPWVAGRELPRFVEQQLHQRARIGEINFNPFTLRLHAREFVLETMEGRPVLGFTDAVVGFRWLSLLRRGWVLDEVRLVDPAVHLEIAKDGRLNLATLVPDSGAADSTQPARFAIGTFSVVNGSIDFEDHRQGYRDRVERLSIDLASLSTLDAEKGSYALAGQTPGGATLRWKGEIALTPLAVTGTLMVGNAGLAELRPYVDDFTEVRVVAGRADLELPYRFALEQGKPRLTLKDAKLGLREFTLSGGGENALLAKLGEISLGGIDFDSATQQASVKAARIGASTVVSGKDKVLLATVGPITLDGAEFALATRRGSAQALGIASAVVVAGDETKPLAGLRQLALDDAAFDLGSQRVSAKVLRVADLMLALERDANGELNLLRIFSGKGGDAASAQKPSAWLASIGVVEIANGSARYTDRTAKTPLALAADGLSGSFSFDATSGAQGMRVRVDAGKFALAKLDALAASAPPGSAQQPAVKLANVSLAGARYDSGANALELDTVRLGSLGVDTALENGRASLLDLIPPAGKSKSEKPLSARVKVFELGEGGVSVADRASGIAFALGRLTGKLRDLSTDRAQPLAFDLSADIKSGGRIALRGHAVPAQGTVEAKMEASSVALAPVQSVLAHYANVKLGSGDVSLSGTLRVGGKDAKLAYSGSAGIANLALDDVAGVRLLGWKSLATESFKATLSPDRVDIDELRLTAPAGRLAIAKDGTSNISRAFAKNQTAVGAGAPPSTAETASRAASPDAAPAATDDEVKPGQEGAVVVGVRRVRVEQGALDFSDDSLSPGFVAKIYELAGTANGLSSDRDARSQFALEGRVDEFGYARLSGSVNPFVPRNRSTFRVELRNVDLATASPYSMRFAGYRIATGRLTADLNYRVRANVIEGDNKITLDKLTLGERVESPDALKLPFELAIALLKDPDGTISLELPVNGNLDDPQFSLAPLIWKAVGHLIGNIVAAPFRALAHLFGGGAEGEGGVIAFDPGKSRLLPPEREKLGHIVQVLAKRPELKLLIPAHFDTEADARGMRRIALEREIGRRAGFALAEDHGPGPVNVEDRPTRAALRALFVERFSRAELDKLRADAEAKARAAGQPAPSVTEKVRNFASGEPQVVNAGEFYQTLLRRVRDAQPLPPNALAELAQQRALAIEVALQAAGADASRMARTIAEPTADAEAKQVTVHLSLAAR